jgi:HEAT repeat protein
LLNPFFGKFAVSRLKSPQITHGLDGLEADLVAGLSENDEAPLLASIELFGALQHVKSVSPLIRRLASDHRSIVHGAIYVALLRLQDYRALKEAGAFAEGINDNPREVVLREQVCELVGEIHDPTVGQVLIGLSRSNSDRLRESVIHALRGIPSAEAEPVFVRALDDPLKWIRYDAVLGLAFIEKKWDLAPSVDAFTADEAFYIGEWKVWWSNSGRTVRQ